MKISELFCNGIFLQKISEVAISSGDLPAWASDVLDLLSDPARREALGRAARAWAQEYDADWTAAQFEDLYRELVRERSKL